MSSGLFEALAAPFPREVVSWRAQSVTKDGTKALALAYIDARDVMNRLDAACGPENWSDAYVETAKGRLICQLSIRIDGEWVTKSDGAGETDVEADKGAISDAFKRAAVKWQVGRYLYDVETPWVPCESYEQGGKPKWKRFTADPWSCVKAKPDSTPAKPYFSTPQERDVFRNGLMSSFAGAVSLDELKGLLADNAAELKKVEATGHPDDLAAVQAVRVAADGNLKRLKPKDAA